MEKIFVHIDVVVVIVAGVDVVSDVRKGMYRIRDFRGSPWPECAGVWLIFWRDFGVDLAQGFAVAPGAGFFADGVVYGVDHAPDLVHVSHEQVISVLVVVVLDDGRPPFIW